MDRIVHHPSPTATPRAAGFRQRARHWVTAGKTKHWWIGLGLLRFHFSLYLAAIPILFLINLIQSPADLWIERAALAWLALLVVHAAIVGLIWAIAVWQREGTVPERAPGAMPQPRSTWITSREAEPQDAEYRTSGTTTTAATPRTSWGMPPASTESSTSIWGPVSPDPTTSGPSPTGPAPQGSIWGDLPVRPAGSNTTAATSTQSSSDAAPSNERVSWRTVTNAAWLAPTNHADDTDDVSNSPSSDSDKRKQA